MSASLPELPPPAGLVRVPDDERRNQTGAGGQPRSRFRFFRTPYVTRLRIGLALAVALVADGLQLVLGPIGWVLFDEIVDIVAMAAESLILGFHPLFLPTFVLEFIPVADMLPTWTGCVVVAASLRRRAQRADGPPSAGLGR